MPEFACEEILFPKGHACRIIRLNKKPNKAAYWYTPNPEVEPCNYVN